ncbi:hypothetical protein GGI04_005753 [Coemansia thaxteri]|nr:hypothetical protein GGI04_005753 [Coemansia thaxteri]
MLCTRMQVKLSYMCGVGTTNQGGNLNRVVGMYKSFIRPTMEYGLEICLPTVTLVKTLEQCQEDMLRAILGVPESVSYAAILLLSGLELIRHHLLEKNPSYVSHKQTYQNED